MNSWAEFQGARAASDPVVAKALKAVDLDEQRLDAIMEYQPEISQVCISPLVVPTVCPSCGLFVLVSDAAPAKCMVTAGCTGKPFKVTSATASKTSRRLPRRRLSLLLQQPRPRPSMGSRSRNLSRGLHQTFSDWGNVSSGVRIGGRDAPESK